MELTNERVQTLCRWAGVLSTDAAAVAVLGGCFQRACDWYTKAGCDLDDDGIETWLYDLATWFYDNRGRSDAELPGYIVKSVHHFRGTAAESEG